MSERIIKSSTEHSHELTKNPKHPVKVSWSVRKGEHEGFTCSLPVLLGAGAVGDNQDLPYNGRYGAYVRRAVSGI